MDEQALREKVAADLAKKDAKQLCFEIAVVEHKHMLRTPLTDVAHPSSHLHGDSPAAASLQGMVDRRELSVIAVERTRMPMVVTDPRQRDNPIVLANQAFLDLTGYGADEVIGRNCRFLQGEATPPSAVAEIRAGVEAERELNVEILNYRKDGAPFWNQLYVSPIHDDQGALLYYFASQKDVSERRKLEALQATEHRLLREVDHRAMNVLAVVEGIVRLSRADDVTLYAASVQGRVQALARAHTMLARRGWEGVPIGELLRGGMEPFGPTRIELNGPEVSLAAGLVQPLALVFHELASNAATHGALSAPPGRVQVNWSEFQDRSVVILGWHERGGPPPSDHRPSGFGLTMMQAILTRQLRGGLEHDWRPEGLSVQLTIPTSAAA